ncbi:MAG TPA: DUF58 domain-containing protein [Pirellulales bacterium]|jgi:uncharacterized protein (DUF58 family)|nr:DUF58 domain-containing protein [Pirellulales bacterium]
MPGTLQHSVERLVARLVLLVVKRVPRALFARGRWRSRPSTLTSKGWVYLAVVLTVFGGAHLRDSNALLILGGTLLGPLLLSFWLPRRALARLAVERRIPSSIATTDRLVVELTVTNRLRWLSAWGVEAEDVCRYEGPLSGVDTGPGRVLFPYVAPRTACRATYEGNPPVRGRYLFGPVRLTTFFPLGLVRHRRRIDLPAELLAWPRLGRLTTAGLRLARHSELESQRTRRRQTRSELDFHGLRDWRPGDSRRWIHWRSTARRGQVVVRQFDVARGHDVALFVDLWQPAGSLAVDPHLAGQRIETALSLAATLVTDICRRGGCRLLLVVAGEELIQLDGRASAALARQALGRLAVVRSRRQAALPIEFVDALSSVSPLCAMLLVSTRSVELADLSAGRDPPLSQVTMARIQSIAVGTPQMAHYFWLV